MKRFKNCRKDSNLTLRALPLDEASRIGNVTLVQMLYNAGLCPGGEADRKGRTAQHYSADNEYEGVVKMLIRNRARFNVRKVCPREDNYTLLHLAAIGGHEKVTQ